MCSDTGLPGFCLPHPPVFNYRCTCCHGVRGDDKGSPAFSSSSLPFSSLRFSLSLSPCFLMRDVPTHAVTVVCDLASEQLRICLPVPFPLPPCLPVEPSFRPLRNPLQVPLPILVHAARLATYCACSLRSRLRATATFLHHPTPKHTAAADEGGMPATASQGDASV